MKKIFANLNYLLLLLMIVYTAFGCLMIFSASSVSAVLRYGVPTNYFVIRQLVAVFLAYFLGFFVLLVPTKHWLYKIGSFFIYGGILWLAILYVVGKVAGGALSWFEIGNRSVQPSEFVKLMLILFLAVYYAGIYKKKKINFLTMLYPVGIAMVVFILVVGQPDLGGAIIIALITMLIDHVGMYFFPDIIWFRVVGRIAFPIYTFFIIFFLLNSYHIYHKFHQSF